MSEKKSDYSSLENQDFEQVNEKPKAITNDLKNRHDKNFLNINWTVLINIFTLLILTMTGVFIYRQTSIFDLQKDVMLANQQFEIEKAQAEAVYEQIHNIMWNTSSSIGAQVFAVQQIPEAMMMSVTRVESDTKSKKLKKVKIYPNLIKLKKLLQSYVKDQRVDRLLKDKNILINGKNYEDLDKKEILLALEPLDRLSSEIIKTLYRLGPSDSNKESLWNVRTELMGNVDFTLPKIRILPDIVKDIKIDLRHIESDFFNFFSITICKYEQCHFQ